MAKRQTYPGTCSFCGNSYAKSGMARHLKACPERQAESAARQGQRTQLYHLAVAGTYNPQYWLHLEMPTSLILADLDYFLRGIWLECCWHLSMFRIGEQNFLSYGFDDWTDEERDMDVELRKVLSPGIRFSHLYDFGSTTHLTLRVVSRQEGVANSEEPIRVLARNEPPHYRCDRCGKPATKMDAWVGLVVCDECEEAGAERGLLPIVNSPRVGVCGYTGNA